MLSFSNGIPHATAENRVAHLSISIIITYITYLYLKACSFSDSISMLGVQRKIIQKKKEEEKTYNNTSVAFLIRSASSSDR